MSNLLEQASLVMIPSGYKEDIVYSEIPINGSGDLQFTRSSNGTRINSAGLVEVCPWNLNTNSEDFATGWSGANRALTADATTAPNGTTTADQLGATGGTAYYAKYITSPVGAHTFSVFLKYGNRQYQQIYGYSGTAYFAEATFDLQNGTVYSIQHGNASIENVGGGWYRCSIYGTTTGVTIEMGIENIAVSTYTYAWGAQLNIGATAKPYFPTTDRLNVPRLTYQNGGGGCPSLLLEKQSTNLALYSEQFDNAAWSKINTTVTANTATSPDGTQNADTIDDSSSSFGNVSQLFVSLTNATYTFSVFVKAVSTATNVRLDLYTTVGDQFFVVFNSATGAYVTGNGGVYTSTAFNNGWFRFTLTATGSGNTNVNVYPNAQSAASTGAVYLWGAQLEASSYPTSYIPTTSSSATRVADACFKTGISSLIGQTSGVLFVDFYAKGSYDSNNLLMLISSGSGGEIIYLNLVSGTIEAYIATSSAVQFLYAGGTALATNTRHKLAIAYANNDIALYHNGTQLATDTSASIPACTLVRVGDFLGGLYQFGNTINQAILFPTRLTNAELASLTTI